MEFLASQLTVGGWRELLSQSSTANWMQSWPYAQACYKRDFKPSQFTVIKHKGGPVGLMALQQIELGPIKLLELHRGPLWLNCFHDENFLAEFTDLFNERYPQHWLQRRRWLPEWENTPSAQSLLEKTGFRILPQTFQTITLDIRKDESQLRQDLDQKWRNSLNKALKSELEISIDWRAQNLDHFLKRYELHKSIKNFQGPSSAFLKTEIQAAVPFQEALMIWARHQNEIVSGAYFLIHGRNISYRMSWNTPLGRQKNAHYLLLWKALEIGKLRNLDNFDLGGIKPLEAPGVTRFKAGLGGRHQDFLGLFR